MMTGLEAVVRAAQFLSLMTIFGTLTLGALLGGMRAEPRHERASVRVLNAAAFTALVAAILWSVLLWSEGRADVGVLIARVIVSVLLVVFVVMRLARTWAIAATGVELALVAATSHAAFSAGAFSLLRAANDAVHLLSAGFWLGALVALLPRAVATRRRPKDLLPVLSAFSPWGAVAVAILIASGSLNAVLILRPASGHWSTAYLTLFTAKLVLATVMVALALTNRLLSRDIRLGDAEGGENLAASIIAELAVGILIVMIVGLLGIIAPGA
jgi:copper resistance protein D